MNKAPEQITIARHLGSDEYVTIPEGETMSMGYVDSHTYYHEDEVNAVVAAAYGTAAQAAISDGCDYIAELISSCTPSDAKAALDRIVQEGLREALQVKPLVWEYPCEYGVLMRSRTSIGTYSIHVDDDSAFGRLICYLHLTDDGDCTRYAIDLGADYREPEEMAARCEADHERRILSSLKGVKDEM